MAAADVRANRTLPALLVNRVERPNHQASAPASAVREANRLRALLERTADALDLALDSDWRTSVDIMLDLSDEIHAELVP